MANEGVPKSPCSALPTKLKYWTYQGRSKPILTRNSSICCTLMRSAPSPRITSVGIAGEEQHPEGDDADARHNHERLQQAADDIAHGMLDLMIGRQVAVREGGTAGVSDGRPRLIEWFSDEVAGDPVARRDLPKLGLDPTAHVAGASGQRVLKLQPAGGLAGLGRSPSSRMRWRCRSSGGSGIGIADSRAFV